jgi:hypothetical protein
MTQKLTTEVFQKLIRSAVAAKQHSYSPYSKFRVGAALLTGEGAIVSGDRLIPFYSPSPLPALILTLGPKYT